MHLPITIQVNARIAIIRVVGGELALNIVGVSIANPAIQELLLPAIIHINVQPVIAPIPGLEVISTTPVLLIASPVIKKIVPLSMTEANAQTVIIQSDGVMMIWHLCLMVSCRKLTVRHAIIPLQL